jgi:hypothetical protein
MNRIYIVRYRLPKDISIDRNFFAHSEFTVEVCNAKTNVDNDMNSCLAIQSRMYGRVKAAIDICISSLWALTETGAVLVAAVK